MANNLQINVNVGGNALSQLQAVEQRIRKTDTAVKTATGGFNKFGTSAANTTRSVRKFSSAGIQQAGFQVGDFAVQVQNGTNVLTAFGQQGSQLAGIFGAQGAVIGAVIAIVSALGTAYMKSRDVAKSFTEELDELSDSVKDLSGFALSNFERFDHLQKKFGEVTEEVEKLFEAQKQLAQFELQNQLQKTITALKEELSVVDNLARRQQKADEAQSKRKDEQVKAERSLRQALREVSAEFEISKQQAELLGASFAKLSELNPFTQSVEAAKEVQQIFDIISTKSLEDMSVAQREVAENLLRLREAFLEAGFVIDQIGQKAVNTVGITAEQAKNLADGIAGSFGSAFTDVVKGTKSVKEAFRNMAASIIDQLFQVLVVQRLVGFISGGLQKKFPNVFGTGGGTSTAAIGGSQQRGRPVIVGERGKELFIPASSGSIVANKNMQGGGVTINQTINVTTGVQQTVRTEIASLMPQIAEATKTAVADARMRGGTFSKAFG
tara:strand:- start:929 stop:2416 length:1488 start_codon:yes stop_codon:yes gene_type:complete